MDQLLHNTPISHLQIMVNIANLMPLVGKNAIGNKHLVTLSAQEVLEHLNFTKLSAMIAKCLKLFEQYEKELNDNFIRIGKEGNVNPSQV